VGHRKKTNPDGLEGGQKEALEGADIVIAASKPGPGIITKEDVRGMASDAIVFACANPIPRSGHGRRRKAAPRS